MPRYDSPGTRVPRNTIPDRASILQGLCVGLLGPTPPAIRIPREEIVDPPPNTGILRYERRSFHGTKIVVKQRFLN